MLEQTGHYYGPGENPVHPESSYVSPLRSVPADDNSPVPEGSVRLRLEYVVDESGDLRIVNKK